MKTINLNTKKLSLKILAVSGLLFAIILVLSFTTEDKEELANNAGQAMPVEVAVPVYEKITEWDEYTGRFEASSRVEVRARVSGFLESVNFVD
ncbi:MAG: efflux transporter periplasmic adaptor subunit, partial [Leeuwenhoekiella sp.]